MRTCLTCGIEIPDSRRKELYELYMRRHDRINNWDLVDICAPFVVGRYLIDKPRKILTKLAKSRDMWERRTAIVATAKLPETTMSPIPEFPLLYLNEARDNARS